MLSMLHAEEYLSTILECIVTCISFLISLNVHRKTGINIDIDQIQKEIVLGYDVPSEYWQYAPDLALSSDICEYLDYQEIQMCESIGKGGFAEVFKAKRNNHLLAVKKITQNSTENFKEFRNEAVLCSRIEHPKIISFYGITIQPFSLVMEYALHGNLYNLVDDLSIYYPWQYIAKLASDIAEAIQFIHSQEIPIAHRDIKSPNILIMSYNYEDYVVAKLTDFGSAQYTVGPLVGRVVDNPIWLAPEVLEDRPYDHSVDIYSYIFMIFTQYKIWNNIVGNR